MHVKSWVAACLATLAIAGSPGEGRTDSVFVVRGQMRENIRETPLKRYVPERAYPDSVIDPVRRHMLVVRARRLSVQNPSDGGFGSVPCGWFSIGPTNVGGRITDIAISESEPNIMFITTVGGVWRSLDRAASWYRVSDGLDPGVFGAVAVHPDDPSDVFIGGGDPNGDFQFPVGGPGIWRSTAGGVSGSWVDVSPSGLGTGAVRRLRIDANGSGRVYAATDAGLFTAALGGTGVTWEQLGGFDEPCTDLVIDRSVTPVRVFVGTTTGFGGGGSGIYRYDGSWTRLSSGLGSGDVCALALTIAPTDPQVLYAKVVDRSGDGCGLRGVYRTSNGGDSWTSIAGPGSIVDDSFWYTDFNCAIEVDPTDSDRVYVCSRRLYRYETGGSWVDLTDTGEAGYTTAYATARPHEDHHRVTFDPEDPRTFFTGNDGGLDRYVADPDGRWHFEDAGHGLTLTQFYDLAVQPATAPLAAGVSQDNGVGVTYGNRTWYADAWFDGTSVGVDAANGVRIYNTHLVWTEFLLSVTSDLVMHSGGTGVISAEEADPCDVVAVDETDAGHALAAGCGGTRPLLMRTTDGETWTSVPTDKPFDNGGSIHAIAIGPGSGFRTYFVGHGKPGGNAQIWSTDDGGDDWTEYDTGISDLRLNAIAADPHDASRAYAVFGGESGGIVQVTMDRGTTWHTLALDGLPGAPITGVVVDPFDAEHVFLATSVGVYEGTVDASGTLAGSWQDFNEGLPVGIDVTAIRATEASGSLTIATMGNGAFRRTIDPSLECAAVQLSIRDNVFDRGFQPAPHRVPDPEHPVCVDPPECRTYAPDESPGGELKWWQSTDIRVDAGALAPIQNRVHAVDAVAMESCPIEAASCPAGTILDRMPVSGRTSRVHVQVTNRGMQAATVRPRVMLLWADASIKLPLLPPHFWTKSFPADGVFESLGDAGWHLVDPDHPIRTLEPMDPDHPQVATWSWDVPEDVRGHTCILAIVESAEDPLNDVRAVDERRVPWLVRNKHQIGLRNLHILDPEAGASDEAVTHILSLTNSTGRVESVDFILSRAGIGPGTQIQLLLPYGTNLGRRRTQPLRLDPGFRRRLARLDIRSDNVVEIGEADTLLTGFRLQPNTTMRIGLVIRPDPQPAPDYGFTGTATPRWPAGRFTIAARVRGEEVGGSTFVIRTTERSTRPRRPLR